MVLPKIEKKLRTDTPLVGYPPYGQIHPHSTGNSKSTAQNEADNQYNNRPVAFFTHVVGNGRIIQVAPTGRGAYDVGGDWNYWTYAAVEIIESHKTKEEFLKDYRIYVELLRALADEAKIPKKLDSGEIGINTHDYCRRHQPNNGTDHVDPYPYLEKWGITKAQFKKDIENGLGKGDVSTVTKNTLKHWVKTGYYTEGYDANKKVKDFLDKNKMGYKTKKEGKKVWYIVGWFGQGSSWKRQLEDFLVANNFSYSVHESEPK
ncbi:N-acetylmuramoyl-L-alanine amidase [Vagococcus fluvialis]|uniref:N-acetylmuramoyl-L-alanine amidase n=1 Tax=Vagococcus fluvialis TaxID=2738 RepID=UPI0032D99807